ncbi:GlsB/YeaQ/YmgE family stress response membrane protein [Paracoccus sp. S-4012]|nr:GlsB/YeaQ/YmgE family stress response membrane protein [Paracoccus sp. S-4012]
MGLIVSLIVGGIAGWLAGEIVKGRGQGVLMNIVVGIIGALVASWIFPAIGIGPAGGSVLWAFIYSLIGAVILLLIVGLFTRRA